MSEETPKITTVKKEKDPKRVEAGKRLAAISKEARERKMRERLEQESGGWGVSYGLILGSIGVLAAVGSLYYARKDYVRQEERNDSCVEEPVVVSKKTTSKLDCL